METLGRLGPQHESCGCSGECRYLSPATLLTFASQIVLECMHTGKPRKPTHILILIPTFRPAAAFVAEARGAVHGVPVFDKLLHRWALVNWSMDLAVNIGVTAGIAYRLWSVGAELHSATGRKSNKYHGALLTVIESGGLFTTATLVTVALYLSGEIATVMAIDSVTQLAASKTSHWHVTILNCDPDTSPVAHHVSFRVAVGVMSTDKTSAVFASASGLPMETQPLNLCTALTAFPHSVYRRRMLAKGR
jgi:hypothetical protein